MIKYGYTFEEEDDTSKVSKDKIKKRKKSAQINKEKEPEKK